nr:hypothetical protein [Anaerobacillus isosaccharinicus]
MRTSLWKNKNFVLLWGGQTVSKLGDRFLQIALMWYIYTATGSSLALDISLICFTIPMIFITVVPIGTIFGSFIINYYDVNHILIVFGIIVLLSSLSLIYLILKVSTKTQINQLHEA